MIADGFLVVDKPPGVTSHDVVAVVRAVTGLKKVGHTGTLDPFATGVLPLALGGATRLIQFLDESVKVYDATITLGQATDTADPTGTVVREAPVPALGEAAVLAVLADFVGERMQRPPRYSAVKVKGTPLYTYARRGQDVEIQPRPVRVWSMELVELAEASLRVVIRCTRGTYARVLAEEIGEALGSVGHLSALRRLGSGPFSIEQALSLSRLSEIVTGDPRWDVVLRPARGEARVPWRPRSDVFDGLRPFVVAPRAALGHLPALAMTPEDVRRFFRTGAVPAHPARDERNVVLLDGDEVIGVVAPGASHSAPLSRERVPPPRPPPPTRLT